MVLDLKFITNFYQEILLGQKKTLCIAGPGIDNVDTLPMDAEMLAAAAADLLHDAPGGSGVSGDAGGKGDSHDSNDPSYPTGSYVSKNDVEKSTGDLPSRPAALDGLKPIGPVEQRELKPKKKARAKKPQPEMEPKDDTRPAEEKKVEPKRRGRKRKIETPDDQQPAEPAEKPKPKAKARGRKSKGEGETACEKGPKTKKSAEKKKKQINLVDGDASAPSSGSAASASTSGFAVVAESSGSTGAGAPDEPSGAVDDAASTTAVDPREASREERKRKASRKSSAYHVAKKRALSEGKSVTEATEIAKQVPLVLTCWIFLVLDFVYLPST